MFSALRVTGLLLAVLPFLLVERAHSDDDVLLFSFFRGNGEEGLFLAWSEDGIQWQEIKPNFTWLTPKIGESVLMRDPCIIKGGDEQYHMVWTPGWHEKGIGHATSKDLIHWSEQQYIPVMAHEATAHNAWAPEVFYDVASAQYFLFWASTIPERFPETQGQGDGDNNHRMYYTTTKDFTAFSETRLFYDPGFNVIDSTVIKTDTHYLMFLKNESLTPEEKNIRVATADNPAGPWSAASPKITGDYWAEGPSAIQWGDHWYVYFDKYRKHRYGALRTTDFQTWEDVSEQITMPEGIRHGTALRVPRSVLTALQAHAEAGE